MTEIVRGTIIGEVTTKKVYAFFTHKGEPITGTRWFENDEEAIAWFKEHWPSRYKTGAEMRVWDGS